MQIPLYQEQRNLRECKATGAMVIFIAYGSKANKKVEPSADKNTYIPTRQCPKPSGIFENKSNCSTFYLCTNGVHHKQECPGGLHYDRKRTKCNFPKIAKCQGKKKKKPPVTPTSQAVRKPRKSKFCPKLDGIFPNEKNCSTFYFCVDGTAYQQECPQGLVFDSKNVKCDFPKVVGCKPPPGTLSILTCPEDSGLFRHPTSCGTFYLCRQGRSYRYDCPVGLIFDYNQKRCEYPRNVKCPEHYLDRRKHSHYYMKVRQINIMDYVT
ncbi:peritrophin-1-like [Stegodyphus dumicola]|uniref:peritrophin-1-like n=1 Tax=Stegodyphus dumicola TaxID=202533 RepID=UPI0015ABDF0E|nr:peritrophin-1-like [Stegodyphus dumicola]